MSVFIKGMAAISPQKTFENNSFLSEIQEFIGNQLNAVEPSYEGIIDLRAIRRMSKIIRISVAASNKALEEAGVEIPDGIITGTSYGCMADTENFLRKMIDSKEVALNPTPFIQSTHNTMSGQIALLQHCNGYNSTYTQGGFSFENCLVDASLLLADNPGWNLLVGGVDEIIEVSHKILNRFDLYRKENVSNLSLLNLPAEGTMDGEGCTYFVLSGNKQNALAEIKSIKTIYKPANASHVIESLLKFLSENNLNPTEIDVLLTGRSGDTRYDGIYEKVENIFPESSLLFFKHLSGEYPTASAFATWVGTNALEHNQTPEILARKLFGKTSIRNVLIYNNYFGVYHSLILLQK
jgi:hypothetical protein